MSSTYARGMRLLRRQTDAPSGTFAWEFTLPRPVGCVSFHLSTRTSASHLAVLITSTRPEPIYLFSRVHFLNKLRVAVVHSSSVTRWTDDEWDDESSFVWRMVRRARQKAEDFYEGKIRWKRVVISNLFLYPIGVIPRRGADKGTNTKQSNP